jgi:hypothetical protein
VNFLYILVGAVLILIGIWVGTALSGDSNKTTISIKKEPTE